jgi:tripartite-type tricarboxylate transporter receptor subunit TctC
MNPMKTLLPAFVAAVGVLLGTPASAQPWPTKPVRIVVPYGTGGGSDVLARQLAQKLSVMWAQPVSVENRAGASGNLGTEIVVKSPPDGYTLMMQNTTIAVNPAIMVKMPFDVQRDLAPVVLVGFTPIMLVAHPSANVASIKELTEAAKASPGKLGYASCGNGTPQNFAAELYQASAGVSLIHAPYRGCAPGLTDVLGGQVPLAALSANMVVPHLKSGRLKGLALTSREKYRLTPEVPTMESLGFRDFDFANWYGIMGPAGLPKAVIERITTDVMAVMAMPDVAANMSTAGIEKLIGNAGEFAEVLRADLAKYAQVAKRANIKAE